MHDVSVHTRVPPPPPLPPLPAPPYPFSTKQLCTNQVMTGGNLALVNSCKQRSPIRVIRGNAKIKKGSPVYTYHGLYKIDMWREARGEGGFKIFRFHLVRIPNQPPVKIPIPPQPTGMGRMRLQLDDKRGVILEDLSKGTEPVPIRCVNRVDDTFPPPFLYRAAPTHFSQGGGAGVDHGVIEHCNCQGGCRDDDTCTCGLMTGRMSYTEAGALKEVLPAVFECGPKCACATSPGGCKNRVSQNGTRYLLEVFKTQQKGWGVRCKDPIPAGGWRGVGT